MEELNGTFIARMIEWMRKTGHSEKDILECIEYCVSEEVTKAE